MFDVSDAFVETYFFCSKTFCIMLTNIQIILTQFVL